MAAESVANLFDLLKEVWTQDRLERQFYNENRFLDKIEKVNKYTIGRQAQVPIEKSLPGGYTVKTAAGGALNAADALHVDRADYTLTYHWQQVEIETGALNQADSGAHTTVDAADQTIESNIAALRREVGRQSVSNQDGIIAACDTGGASTTVELTTTGYGYDAIVRGWLRPGVAVDIGTAGDADTVVAASVITAVKESASDPDITIGSSVSTTATTHFVSLAGSRSASTGASIEMNGLRQIAGSTTLAVGGLDPDTAGEEFWQPAEVDTTTTIVSLDLLLRLQRKVYQKTGKWPTYVTTSPKQCADLYALFQSQVRFQGDSGGEAGSVDGFKWNGMNITCDPDIPDRELYMLTLEDFLVITGGRFGKPTWASEIEGGGGKFAWKQGNTSFVDAVVYPIQLGVKRRNSHAAAIGLTG